MDVRSAIRPIIVALVSLGLVVLVIVLFIKGFSGHPANEANRVDVSKYSYDPAIATLLTDGPTNLDQNHFQVRISVSGTENEIDIIQGYQGNVIKHQTYTNNPSGFDAFLQALQLLNFSKGRKKPTNFQGFCPTGDRYVYSFTNGQTELFKFWSTSCGSGTFEGNASAVRQLFLQQIPPNDLSKLVSGTGVTF